MTKINNSFKNLKFTSIIASAVTMLVAIVVFGMPESTDAQLRQETLEEAITKEGMKMIMDPNVTVSDLSSVPVDDILDYIGQKISAKPCPVPEGMNPIVYVGSIDPSMRSIKMSETTAQNMIDVKYCPNDTVIDQMAAESAQRGEKIIQGIVDDVGPGEDIDDAIKRYEDKLGIELPDGLKETIEDEYNKNND